jgi:hypothetical protein
MVALGTDVREEELEVIRTLKSEEVLSDEADKNLRRVASVVENAFNFLNTVVNDRDAFLQRLQSHGDFSETIKNLTDQLSSLEPLLKIVNGELKELSGKGIRVAYLIKDVVEKQRRMIPSFNLRGRAVIKRIEVLETSEINEINIKVVSLELCSNFLDGASNRRRTVLDHLRTAKRGHDALSQNPAVANMVFSSLSRARQLLSEMNTQISNADGLIIRFKSYLDIAGKQSEEEAKAFEELIAKLSSHYFHP